jgi:hypothetical protein
MKSCCKKRANRQWRNLAGMRLFRVVSGKKWYDFRCAKCGEVHSTQDKSRS